MTTVDIKATQPDGIKPLGGNDEDDAKLKALYEDIENDVRKPKKFHVKPSVEDASRAEHEKESEGKQSVLRPGGESPA